MKKLILLLALIVSAQTAYGVEKQLRTVCLGGVQYYVFSEWRSLQHQGFGYGYMAPAYDPLTKEVKTCLNTEFTCDYGDNDSFLHKITTKKCVNR